MDIALLNERIVIQKNAVTTDEIGNHTNAWSLYYNCHATVSGTNISGESNEAGQTVDDTEISFTVRYCKRTVAVNNTEYRIIFRNEIYNIVTVDFMNFKKKCIKFKCRKARR